LKQINPNLRTHISIGGWGFNDPQDPSGIGTHTYQLFSQMAANESSRSQFIESLVNYARHFNFDGVDIDWEYPGDLTRGGTEDDFENFITLLQQLNSACKAVTPNLMLSMASPAIIPSGVPQKYRDNPELYYQWLARCSTYLDHFNLMAYDYHGPFDNPKITGVNAPLNQDTMPSSVNCIKATLSNYIQNGVPASKIVLGLATYGHSYGGVQNLSSTSNAPGLAFTSSGQAGPSTGSPGMLSYYEIADMIALNQLTFGSDPITETAYAYNTTSKEWISFDTPQTIALKAQYAKSLSLGGVMFWAIDDDEYAWGTKFPNIRSAYDIFYPSIKKIKRNNIESNLRSQR
jgi:chitinase